MNSVKKELRQRLAELGIYKKVYVDEETATAYHRGEKEVPEDVFREYIPESFGGFYRIEDNDLTADERRELLLLKIYEELEATEQHTRTTKNCVVFFTALAVISLALSFLVFLISIG